MGIVPCFLSLVPFLNSGEEMEVYVPK